jgi:excisionase family DNA binding protein
MATRLRPPDLTTGQIARHCHVSIPTVKRWIQRGKLAAFSTPGGHRRVALDAFQRFLKEYRMPSYPHEPPPGGTRRSPRRKR